ncbi:MAG TPA: hypothetical protein DDW94_01305 [Deltaproteobacteria bacterium]|nr:MAG: hypothetical protein A2Z79_06675 [Deltaproteobacteria bacterium GWA2_55_82]OGQ63302.1 MAG: hypothetical protein A3I81_00925 [Deltaproteobacteria bacterium RIFCSPLOWO2_02_FULL_55_12]OIJ73138.1 MAG: hypothetical protein A2V21_301990 [Deltaproteobacteria bacterium GWC2_55_46]HBG45609.1 hypothetical protein [Deltaproteobacteria bacterium]HCY10440.1 hypothetical protein [Deltaproteobacteria bacterium]
MVKVETTARFFTHDSLPTESVEKHHDTAVILHLYYPDLWEETSLYLRNIEGDFDLFVSIPEDVDFAEQKIFEGHRDTYIYRCENRGRDIAPFLEILSSIIDRQYKYVLKIHTKKTRHRQDGDIWRHDLMEKLLGSKMLVQKIKVTFESNLNTGVIAPQGHVLPLSFNLGANEPKVRKLAEIINIPYTGAQFQFVAGSMFWFRPLALKQLLSLKLSRNDFEPEQGQLDGTLAHALERFLGLLLVSSGFRIVETGEKTETDKDYRFTRQPIFLIRIFNRFKAMIKVFF